MDDLWNLDSVHLRQSFLGAVCHCALNKTSFRISMEVFPMFRFFARKVFAKVPTFLSFSDGPPYPGWDDMPFQRNPMYCFAWGAHCAWAAGIFLPCELDSMQWWYTWLIFSFWLGKLRQFSDNHKVHGIGVCACPSRISTTLDSEG